LVTSPEPDALGFDDTSALPPYVSLYVLELAWALALPLEASSAEPLVALAAAAAPVVVAVVVDVALAGEPLTVPVPVAAIPALTVVSPVVAELVWLVLAAIVVAPLPAVAELLTDGVTVCEMAPVEPSHSDSKKQLRPVLAFVPVNPPEASLLAYGLLSMVVLPVWFELSALGCTYRLLPETEPVPDAYGFDETVALPPDVSLVVDELAFALASPLGPSSALPVVAVAFAGPPVVVLLVPDVADAPDPETEAVPVAVIGALTFVAPTDAVLPWVVPAVMFVAPLPADALLVTDGVTVCVMAPVLPASVVAAVAALPAVAASLEHPLPPLPLPVFAVVQVLPPVAVL
jgi:hypothetical protein